jgi:Mg/Co/Ni transporter MgtE
VITILTTAKANKILVEQDADERNKLIDALSEQDAKQLLKFMTQVLNNKK